ncbi:MAG: hypothetical protein FWC61_02615 [Proteobacteria bacterium]|nr:hypothetical protein [Pseudomonadota bacterium]
MKKTFLCFMLYALCLVPLAGCLKAPGQQGEVPPYDTVQVIDNLVVDQNSVPIFPRKAALTTDTARRFSIELPKRCTVDWDNQTILSVVPETPMEMTRLAVGDPLPDFNVEDYSFEKLTVKDALQKLLKGTRIRVIEDEDLPDKITGTIKSGSLSDAVELIAKMGKVYYAYDDNARQLRIGAHGKWLIKMPRDQNMIMALLDAMRGAEMRNLLVNWEDKTVSLEGNFQTERDVKKIIADMGSRKFLIAWDMDVYRVYPRTDNPIVWMNILPAMGENNVKMSIPGVVGRLLLTSPEINTKTLQQFLSQQANLVLISQGTFVIPNGWQSRFDIGQCSREERLETNLIVGAQATYGDYAGMKKLDAKIVLRTNSGEISAFNVPSALGDNYVIIGIPTHSFVDTPETLISPFAELVVFMSPRIISIVPRQQNFTPVSGQALRDYLEE